MSSFKTTYRDAVNDLFESHLGAAPLFTVYSGPGPATVGTAASGTKLYSFALPSDWMAASSSGLKAKSGTWSGPAIAAPGTIGYARFRNSGDTTDYYQFSITRAFSLVTSALTAAGNNVLTFTSTLGVTDGDGVFGTGVQDDTTVFSHTSTTVTLSKPTLTGVSNGATIYFGDTSGEIWLNSLTVSTIGQTLTISTFTLLANGE